MFGCPDINEMTVLAQQQEKATQGEKKGGREEN